MPLTADCMQALLLNLPVAEVSLVRPQCPSLPTTCATHKVCPSGRRLLSGSSTGCPFTLSILNFPLYRQGPQALAGQAQEQGVHGAHALDGHRHRRRLLGAGRPGSGLLGGWGLRGCATAHRIEGWGSIVMAWDLTHEEVKAGYLLDDLFSEEHDSYIRGLSVHAHELAFACEDQVRIVDVRKGSHDSHIQTLSSVEGVPADHAISRALRHPRCRLRGRPQPRDRVGQGPIPGSAHHLCERAVWAQWQPPGCARAERQRLCLRSLSARGLGRCAYPGDDYLPYLLHAGQLHRGGHPVQYHRRHTCYYNGILWKTPAFPPLPSCLFWFFDRYQGILWKTPAFSPLPSCPL